MEAQFDNIKSAYSSIPLPLAHLLRAVFHRMKANKHAIAQLKIGYDEKSETTKDRDREVDEMIEQISFAQRAVGEAVIRTMHKRQALGSRIRRLCREVLERWRGRRKGTEKEIG
jgi:hypothetical protein